MSAQVLAASVASTGVPALALAPQRTQTSVPPNLSGSSKENGAAVKLAAHAPFKCPRTPSFPTAALLGSLASYAAQSCQADVDVLSLGAQDAQDAESARCVFLNDERADLLLALVSADTSSCDDAIKARLHLAREVLSIYTDVTDAKRALMSVAQRIDATLAYAQRTQPCVGLACWHAPVATVNRKAIESALDHVATSSGVAAIFTDDGCIVASSRAWRALHPMTRTVLSCDVSDELHSRAARERVVYLPSDSEPTASSSRHARALFTVPISLNSETTSCLHLSLAAEKESASEESTIAVARAMTSDKDVLHHLVAADESARARTAGVNAQGAACVRSSLLCSMNDGMMILSHAPSTADSTVAEDADLLTTFGAEVERFRMEEPESSALTLMLKECTLASAHAGGIFCCVVVPGTSAATAEAGARAALRMLCKTYL